MVGTFFQINQLARTYDTRRCSYARGRLRL
jgi:hypothetical protein